VTALHLACVHGHTATAELLIAKGADVEAEDDVRQGDKGDWRGVERACPDGDSNRVSGSRGIMSHRDESSDWCGASVSGWLVDHGLAG